MHNISKSHVLLHCLLIILIICSTSAAAAPQITYTILEKKTHNSDSFTQGLVYQDGKLIESSGHYGKSFIFEYSAAQGTIGSFSKLPRSIFAEGITLFNNHIYLLSWKAGKLFVLDEKTFAIVDTKQFKGEGWGLTHNEQHFISSDGSEYLFFRNKETFAVESRLKVLDGAKRWSKINELEYVDGIVWANVWMQANILAIDAKTGQVLGVANFSSLLKENTRRPLHEVLNGIAYDKNSQTFWLTGKMWPYRYRVKFNLEDLKSHKKLR